MMSKCGSELPDYIIGPVFNLFTKLRGNFGRSSWPDLLGQSSIDSCDWQYIDQARVSE